MKRPVRPVALVVLTALALYPGLTSVFQGLYPWVTGQPFNLMGQEGFLVDLLVRTMHLPIAVPNLLKAAIGLAWLGAVPGLWAGDGRAYPLALLAAAGSLLLGVGPAVCGVLGLVCLVAFRETPEVVAA